MGKGFQAFLANYSIIYNLITGEREQNLDFARALFKIFLFSTKSRHRRHHSKKKSVGSTHRLKLSPIGLEPQHPKPKLRTLVVEQ